MKPKLATSPVGTIAHELNAWFWGLCKGYKVV